jgi:hypothetical protein
MSDEHAPTEIPSLEDNPRTHDAYEQSGTGTPRSAEDGNLVHGAHADADAAVDPAVIVGATTSSHPAEANDVTINRSGSGGTGGASVEEPGDEATEG